MTHRVADLPECQILLRGDERRAGPGGKFARGVGESLESRVFSGVVMGLMGLLELRASRRKPSNYTGLR